MKYKLIDIITVPTTISPLTATVTFGSKSVKKYDAFMRLNPDETYETDDEVLLESLRNFEFTSRYSSAVVEELKRANIPYTVEACRSCGGKVKKVKYHPVEVIE